jgi:hypothetical protein
MTNMPKRFLGTVAVVLCLFAIGCSNSASADQRDKASAPTPAPGARGTAEAALTGPLALVPSNAAGFVHIRLADFWSSQGFAELRHILGKSGREAWQLFEQKYVPAPSTMETLTLVFPTPESASGSIFFGLADRVSPVLAVTTTKAYDRALLEKAFGAHTRQTQHENQSYYTVAANQIAFQFVDDRTFVVASEKALRQWLSRSAGEAGKGPLQAALLEANQKHAAVAGFNPAALPTEPFGPFQASKTFKSVSSVIGDPPAAQQPAPTAPAVEKPRTNLWTTFAQPLLKARCITLTFDLDSELHGKAKVDFAGAEEAENGVKAIRAGLQAAREALAAAARDSERDLREGPKIFSFIGKPAEKKNHGPKVLLAEFDQARSDLGKLVEIGIYRALDEQLQALPVARRDRSVRLEASAPVNATTLLFTFTAIASLGANANATFTTVGDTITLSPANPPDASKGPKAGPDLAALLPPGTRAVALRVKTDAVTGAFAALPLARVDVIWTTAGGKDRVAKLILQNVLVLAVDNPLQGDTNTLVTLALSPEDAVTVAAAQNTGSFSLVLRGFRDENRKVDKR